MVVVCAEKQQEDISDYGNWEAELSWDLQVFPKTAPDEKKVNEFHYISQDEFMGSCCQIYLDCTYIQKEYEQELGRIQKIANVAYSESCMAYPAYLVCLGDHNISEYVIPKEEEKRMIYVFLSSEEVGEIVFPMEYLPYGYRDAGDCDYVYETQFKESGEISDVTANPVVNTQFSYFTKEKSKYHQFYHDSQSLKSDLEIFPAEIEDDMTVNDYVITTPKNLVL